MKEETRKRLSELILEELAEKIRVDENLRRKLEPFTDLPVEKVATAVLKQFEYLLSSELRELIIHLIEQEIAAEESAATIDSVNHALPPESIVDADTSVPAITEETTEAAQEELVSQESVMEHFYTKEPIPLEPLDIELLPDDWYYLYGFSYAPDSTGKGVPSKKLSLVGADGKNPIFLLDYGDVRFYINKMTAEDYARDRSGKPMLASQKTSDYKFEHEKTLNTLRADDVIVTFPYWTIIQSREEIIKKIEDKYVELLRALIDVHDAIEWDVEIFAFDQHIIGLPAFTEISKERISHRETKHPVSKGRNAKVVEKLIMQEKSLAQELHSRLLLYSTKAKLDFIIRLDNAFIDDWKSILSSRYTVGKEKRKNFTQTIKSLQNEYEEFRLMFRASNPNVRFSF